MTVPLQESRIFSSLKIWETDSETIQNGTVAGSLKTMGLRPLDPQHFLEFRKSFS